MMMISSRKSSTFSRMTSPVGGIAGDPEIINMSDACSKKLKSCLAEIDADQIQRESLVTALQNAAVVLETIFLARSKRGLNHLGDDEDILSNVTASSMPGSVQEWISTTFSRRSSVVKPPRRRLRSLANAIRAGLVFDRLYRRLSLATEIEFPPDVLLMTKSTLSDWNFDIFMLDEASNHHSLKAIGYELLLHYNLLDKFCIDVPTLDRLLTAIEEGYSLHNNPYHNLVHGADVTQTAHYMISQSNLSKWLSDLEIFATLFAALIHDYEHTGTTNNYHINTKTELSLVYNDRNVLENYHVSSIFKILHSKMDHNILTGLSQAEYREFRSLVIDMVLATDMSVHFAQVQAMKDSIPLPENLPRVDVLSYVLHAADISHPAKRWEIHHEWTTRLMEEFFRQGDNEKKAGLPPSPLCDRTTTFVPQCQLGFIDYIVEPCFQTLSDLLDAVSPLLAIASRTEEEDEEVSQQKDGEFSRPRTPTPDSRFLEKPWLNCIVDNQKVWKDLAEQNKHRIDSIAEEEEEEEEKEEKEEKKEDTEKPVQNGVHDASDDDDDKIDPEKHQAQLSIIEQLNVATYDD